MAMRLAGDTRSTKEQGVLRPGGTPEASVECPDGAPSVKELGTV
jgi:hypothetical protein